jgi:hypothetical protein
MCLWNEFFALVLSVESGKLGYIEWWWLGVFIAPTTILAVGFSFLSTGASDSPVRTGHRTIHCLVHATSVACWFRLPLWCTEQSGTPDSLLQPNCC